MKTAEQRRRMPLAQKDLIRNSVANVIAAAKRGELSKSAASRVAVAVLQVLHPGTAIVSGRPTHRKRKPGSLRLSNP